MIDYLCLKLSWHTDEVLDNAHFDNRRKYRSYQLMDEMANTRLVTTIPILSDSNMTAAQRAWRTVEEKLLGCMGFRKKKIELPPPDKDPMRKLLARIAGEKLVPIERLMDYERSKKIDRPTKP